MSIPPIEEQKHDHHKVNMRYTHPTLYRSLTTHSLISIALAINFWNANPTFNPFGWSKDLIGVVFMLFGVTHLVFLNVYRDLRVVRILLVLSFIWYGVWGVVNAQQWWEGRASLQLPIVFVGLSVLRFFLLLESPVNPMTERKQQKRRKR